MIPMNAEWSSIVSDLVLVLPDVLDGHKPTSPLYHFLSKVAAAGVESSPLVEKDPKPFSFAPFGEIVFPHHSMGAINTTHLFGLDELIIYAFYYRTRHLYKKTADLGANLGLHSILMAKLGFSVTCYEPDPVHFEILTRNLSRNNVSQAVTPNQAAVSDREGTMEFVRVLGNTTSSHLAGAKSNAYGELEKFPVKVADFSEIMRKADLVKMDIEGHEAHVIQSTTAKKWASCDVMMEINSPQNAEIIWEHIKKLQLNAFAQKGGWGAVRQLADLPSSYRDGSLFLTRRASMPW
jgi:FkbM family methyltransferase